MEDHQVSEKDDEKWDKIADKKDKANEQKANENSDRQNTEKEELQVIVEDQIKEPAEQQGDNIPTPPRPSYEICGLSNHITRDCRRLIYEICGMDTHMAYDCKNYMPWNLGPKLCAAQVGDQSFFYIKELVDPRVAREKDSTAIISVISGHASGKQIE